MKKDKKRPIEENVMIDDLYIYIFMEEKEYWLSPYCMG